MMNDLGKKIGEANVIIHFNHNLDKMGEPTIPLHFFRLFLEIIGDNPRSEAIEVWQTYLKSYSETEYTLHHMPLDTHKVQLMLDAAKKEVAWFENVKSVLEAFLNKN